MGANVKQNEWRVHDYIHRLHVLIRIRTKEDRGAGRRSGCLSNRDNNTRECHKTCRTTMSLPADTGLKGG